MASANREINNWYETLKSQALNRNEQSVATWSKYKSDLETTKSLLSVIPKKIKHNVMVPIGPKALMPGVIVHTNEFLVNLGETWFAKKTAHQTIEVCDRRIKSCSEILEKLEKERELIVSKSTLPAEQEAFGNEERPEIIEFVTEEENEDWKKQHRIKEKEYRQKLAELRNKEKKSIETEEDLWKHLDELELQEELEDELHRLNADCSSEDESEVSEENPELLSSPKQDQNLDTKEENSESENKTAGNVKTKRRVSFVCDLESSDDEPLRLEIKHSDQIPVVYDPNSEEINSPSDIYNHHLKLVNKMPLSVLKITTNPHRNYDLEVIQNCDTEDEEEEEEPTFLSSILLSEEDKSAPTISTGIQLKNISERSVLNHTQKAVTINKDKKISKFKISRNKSG